MTKTLSDWSTRKLFAHVTNVVLPLFKRFSTSSASRHLPPQRAIFWGDLSWLRIILELQNLVFGLSIPPLSLETPIFSNCGHSLDYAILMFWASPQIQEGVQFCILTRHHTRTLQRRATRLHSKIMQNTPHFLPLYVSFGVTYEGVGTIQRSAVWSSITIAYHFGSPFPFWLMWSTATSLRLVFLSESCALGYSRY